MAVLTPSTQGIECPSCGKHSVVQSQQDTYTCLNCGFKKNLSEPPKADDGFGEVPFFVGLLGFILTIALFL